MRQAVAGITLLLACSGGAGFWRACALSALAQSVIAGCEPLPYVFSAQSEGDNATAIAAVTISIRPTKSGIHADRTAKFTPDEVTAANATVQELMQSAYDVKDDQIVGAPGWLNSPRYDIEAKVDTSASEQGEPGGKRILQTLLSNRFKLAVHRETRLIPVYELVIAGDSPKLRESDSRHSDSALRVIQVESGRIMGREVPIATLASILSDQLGRSVLDNTHLSSHYDVSLQWPTASEPTILTACHRPYRDAVGRLALLRPRISGQWT